MQLKEKLLRYCCYEPRIQILQSDRFGNDTLSAVKVFQRQQGLEEDGIVGPLTWAALTRVDAEKNTDTTQTENAAAEVGMPQHIRKNVTASITAALSGETAVRRAMVLDALQFTADPTQPGAAPRSFYIRGGNLYNTDLSLNVMTEAKLKSYFSRQSYAAYFDSGRKEMMLAAAQAANFTLSGADCSGGVVGLLRHAGVVSSGFDLSANGFAASSRYKEIARAQLRSGDLVHKSGHIGMYLGGGYVAEWMGGAYGCQLTKLMDRRGYNYVSGKMSRMGAWTGFLRPTYY